MKTKNGERIYTAKELATLGRILADFIDNGSWVDIQDDDTLMLDGSVYLTVEEEAVVSRILAGE